MTDTTTRLSLGAHVHHRDYPDLRGVVVGEARDGTPVVETDDGLCELDGWEVDDERE